MVTGRNSPEWVELADGLPPGKRAGFLALEGPVRIAGALVESLRRARAAGTFGDLTPRLAGFALLFGGVRVLSLLGDEPERIGRVAELLGRLNAPEPYDPARSVQKSEA